MQHCAHFSELSNIVYNKVKTTETEQRTLLILDLRGALHSPVPNIFVLRN